MPTLTVEEARAFYDRFGAKQDKQTFYEAPALDALLANAQLGEALSLFEFGCGTGRFAVELLSRHLPPAARYVGVDISTTMVRIASERLAPFGPRASAVLAASSDPRIPFPDTSLDRFISTYVLDLMSDSSVRQVLSEVKRTLRPGGLLCLAGVTHGTTALSRVVMSVWSWLFARNASLVGGCRPTSLLEFVTPAEWDIRFHRVVVAWGVASEVLVAAPGVAS
jgi:ubiquinone/menaquinone biosynthesis C-methylase UbiE